MAHGQSYDSGELVRALNTQGLTKVTEIGAGGMGAVLRAWDGTIGRWVAVKVITSFAASNPENVRRFKAEMQLLGKIRHPAVVGVYSGHTTENLAFFLMDYIPGGNLEQLISQRRSVQRPFTVHDIIYYLSPIADALDAIHDMSPAVIHRDVKPANLLVPENRAASAAAVLTDFGISLVSGDTRFTYTGIVIGSEQYMAPERFDTVAEDGQPGALADNYALALVAWEMLTLHPLFGMMTRQLWRFGERSTALPADLLAISERRYLPQLNALFRAALATDPALRPARAGDFVRGLIGVLETVPMPDESQLTGTAPAAQKPQQTGRDSQPVPAALPSIQKGTVVTAEKLPRRADPVWVIGMIFAVVLGLVILMTVVF